nr:ferredoxin C 2, chloroplastic isoform X2 [Malus domestica]
MAYPSARVRVMDHAIPCNPCISLSIHRKPPLNRQIIWPNTVTHHSNITKWRRNTTSELQTQVAVNDRTGDYSPSVPTHTVTVHDRQRGVSHQFLVPEDQYILHTAESQDITLPFACRHGCCTSCAVRVKSGELRQPEALGISAELKSKCFEGVDATSPYNVIKTSPGVCTSLCGLSII